MANPHQTVASRVGTADLGRVLGADATLTLNALNVLPALLVVLSLVVLIIGHGAGVT